MNDDKAFEDVIRGVRAAAASLDLDADKYEAEARDFYAGCPHVEAVCGYMVHVMDVDSVMRSPIERLIDKAVSK